MGQYNFEELLNNLAGMDWDVAICTAESWFPKAGKGNIDDSSRREFRDQVKQFLFFMRTGVKPDRVTDTDWKKYLIVVEPLVEKGQLKPEVLTLFDAKD